MDVCIFSHLPEYLVCNFTKRLSRLSLTAPTNAVLMLLTLIRNLLIRHPNLQRLIHAPDHTDHTGKYNISQETKIINKNDKIQGDF